MLTNSVILEVSNSTTHVTGDYRFHAALSEAMTVTVEGAHFSELVRSGRWDGNRHYYTFRDKRTFPTGLLSWAVSILKRHGASVRIVDKRVKPRGNRMELDTLRTDLRDYQITAVERAIACTRGVISAAPGSGKTEISFGMIHKLRVRTLFLVNSVDLLHQTARRMMDVIPNVCVKVIGDSQVEQYGEGEPWVVIATVQTLHKKPHLLLNNFGMKISDECHGVAAKTWKVVMNRYSTYYCYGLSGSFDDVYEDRVRYLDIVACTGKPIITIPATMMVRNGYLVQPNITMVAYPALGNTGNYLNDYKQAVVNNGVLNNRVIPNLIREIGKRRKTLILVRLIAHGSHLKRLLARKGYSVAYVHGSSSADVRLKAINDLRNGEKEILIASKIFNQGVDIPEIDAIINLGCDVSYKQVFQKLGRGIRIAKGKSKLDYYDIKPQGSPYLEAAADGRISKYEYLGFPVTLRENGNEGG